MLVLPQLVSDVEDRPLVQAQRLDARSPIPTQGRPTGAASPLGQLQAHVPILDGASRSGYTHIVGNEDGLLIAIAQRFGPALRAIRIDPVTMLRND